jgi:tRNA threonylcarbamoyladenosine biosynthesis protein TsaB
MLLALDTSTQWAGVALYDGEKGLVAERNWRSGRQHTVELMPEVARLLELAGASATDLQAVGVALGPGSFTGLRVALAAAKGLALARGLPIVGAGTLDVVAYPHQDRAWPVVAVVEAGRGRLCWAIYEHGARGWAARAPHVLSSVDELAGALDGQAFFAGELSSAERAFLAGRLGERARFLPPALAMRRAGYLAEIGWRRLQAGERDDPVTLSPIYASEPATFKTTTVN